PTASDISVEIGDTAIFVSLGAGAWQCIFYQRASGKSVYVPPSNKALPRNYSSGVNVTSHPVYNNTLIVAPNSYRSDDDTADIYITAPLTKNFAGGGWQPGNGPGLNTGSPANNTTYGLYVIAKDGDPTGELMYSTPADAQILPP